MNAASTPNVMPFGVTLDQLDALYHLTGKLRANGDLIAAGNTAALAAGSLSVIGETIFETANAVHALIELIGTQTQVELQKLDDNAANANANANANAAAAANGKATARCTNVPKTTALAPALATFDSDMDEVLLQAFSVMQLMTTAMHQSDIQEDVTGACRLVTDLLWKVHEYIASNFDAQPARHRQGIISDRQ
jgi:hypothetical protein